MPETGHKSPDDMLRLDQPYTQFEELDDLSDPDLAIISQLCTEGTYDSVNCVPCRAGEILEERRGILQDMDKYEPEEHPPPQLDALMSEPPVFEEVPVAERFKQQVESLSLLVAEMLDGPPIPPKNVTLEELAVLVYGAEKWSTMITAQGLELSDKQQQILDEIHRVITKVRS